MAIGQQQDANILMQSTNFNLHK